MNHSKQKNYKRALRAGYLGILLNSGLFIIKIGAGVISGSVSIMADAINNLTDFVSSLISVSSLRFRSKRPDKKHPFGYARIEYLGSFLISSLIIYAGITFFVDSINAIFNPKQVIFSGAIVTVLIISIGVKITQYFLFRYYQKIIDSESLRASSIDGLNDAMITLVILIGLTFGSLFNLNLDGYLGVIVACFVVFSGSRIALDAVSGILVERPETEIDNALELLNSYREIVGYPDLLIHTYGPDNIFATVRIEVPKKLTITEGHEIAKKIEDDFEHKLGIQLVVHVDPTEEPSTKDSKMLNEVKEIIKEKITEHFNIHHFHKVMVDDCKLIYFDLAIPGEIKMSDEEITQIIKNNTQKNQLKDKIHIKIDRSYFLE